MAFKVEVNLKPDPAIAAFCGAVFGAVAVIGHELYSVPFRRLPSVDPFIHVAAELAVLMPSSALLFAVIVIIRNRVLC
jgi:hypothetical protein